MWQFVIDIQRDIYFGFADHIKAFANGTGWAAFIAFLPMGVAFGAVHAMTGRVANTSGGSYHPAKAGIFMLC